MIRNRKVFSLGLPLTAPWGSVGVASAATSDQGADDQHAAPPVEEAIRNPEEARLYIAREQFASEHAVTQAYGPDLSKIFNIDFEPRKIEALKSQVAFLYRIGVIDQPTDAIVGWLRGLWRSPGPLSAARSRAGAV